MVRLPSTYDQTAGFVYVLSNPSMPNIIKIGSTERTLKERVAELSSTTSVPTPFVIEHHILVENPLDYELYLHEKFDEYRLNNKREFFKIDINSALKIIQEIEVDSLIQEIEDLWSTDKEVEFIRQYKYMVPTSHFSKGVDEKYEHYLISILDELSSSSLSELKSVLDSIYSKRPDLYKLNLEKISEDLNKLSYKERREFLEKVMPKDLINESGNRESKTVYFDDLISNMNEAEIISRLENLFGKRPNIWKSIKNA